jgi:hypothetical protein
LEWGFLVQGNIFMLKAITRLTAAAGVLMSLPGIAKLGGIDQAKLLGTDNSNASANASGNVLKLLTGAGGGAVNMNGIASLLTGVNGEMEPAAKPSVPKHPAMLIRCTTSNEDGESATTNVEQLPPGAQAMVVDGRIQVFYPSGNPNQ